MRGDSLPSQPLSETPLGGDRAHSCNVHEVGIFTTGGKRAARIGHGVGHNEAAGSPAYSRPLPHQLLRVEHRAVNARAALPACVSTAHERHAPTPHAMRFSIETQHGTPASSAIAATARMSGSGAATIHCGIVAARKLFAHRFGAKTRVAKGAVVGSHNGIAAQQARIVVTRHHHAGSLGTKHNFDLAAFAHELLGEHEQRRGAHATAHDEALPSLGCQPWPKGEISEHTAPVSTSVKYAVPSPTVW